MMQRFSMGSIRSRLLLTLVLGTILAMILGGYVLQSLVRRSLENQLDQSLESRARSIAVLITYEGGVVEFENEDNLAEIAKDIIFSIENINGAVLRQSGVLDGLTLSPWSVDGPPEAESATVFEFSLSDSQRWRAMSLATLPHVDSDDEPAPAALRGPPMLLITVASASEPIERAILAMITAMTGVGTVVIGTICVLLWYGVRMALAPLDQLGVSLGDADARSLDAIEIPKRCPSELEPIYTEFNRLMDRIRSTLHWERLFTDAASHELRTPLAELQSVTEVARRWPDGDRPIKALAEAHAIGKEMQQMVESLLGMTRARTEHHQYVPLRLLPVIDRVLSQKQDELSRKQLAVETSVDSEACWSASPDAVRIIIANLIENAVSHTPTRGSVCISTQGDLGSTAFLVENSPVDLSAKDLDSVTKPFWRKDDARSDRTHVGLGLSVVQRMCEANGHELVLQMDIERRRLSVRVSSRTACMDATSPASNHHPARGQ